MKGFIIRILGHEFSTKLAKDAYESCIKFGIDACYFDAIIPKTLDKFFSEYDVKMSEEFMRKKATEFATQACFASHYCLWQKCVDINEKILILEHDGLMLRNIDDIIHQIEDVCHLDPSRPYRNNYNEILSKEQPTGVKDFLNSNKWTSDREFTGEHFAGCYAYVISPSGSKKLIEFVKKFGAWEADRLVGKNVLNLQITNGSYARLHPFFKSKDYIRKYSTRTNPDFIY